MEIVGTLLAIAADVGELPEAAEGGGFGLDFNLLDTNLINLVIIIGVLIYFGRGFLGKTLSERRNGIASAITEAETRKKEAASVLAKQQQNLAQAQAEATRIRSEAEVSATAARDAILAQAEQDVERMKAAADQDVASQQQRIVNELRQRVAALAMQQVEARLRSDLGETAQQTLIDRGIATLGGS